MKENVRVKSNCDEYNRSIIVRNIIVMNMIVMETILIVMKIIVMNIMVSVYVYVRVWRNLALTVRSVWETMCGCGCESMCASSVRDRMYAVRERERMGVGVRVSAQEQ